MVLNEATVWTDKARTARRKESTALQKEEKGLKGRIGIAGPAYNITGVTLCGCIIGL